MAVCTDYQAAAAILRKQEEILQPEHFTNKEAWELGQLMAEEIQRRGIDLAVEIAKVNGNTIFKYATDGTNLNNQRWMKRKFNTVSYMEQSSLLATVMSHITGERVTTHGLSASDYIFCGGGFPIRVKGGGMTMIISVSNLAHEMDHQFIIDCLSRYLDVEVPALEDQIPIPEP